MRDELEQGWVVVRGHLQQADGMIASRPEAASRRVQYAEYLSHNELELALDQLEEAGEELDALPAAFWTELACAADRMKLEKRAERLRARADRVS